MIFHQVPAPWRSYPAQWRRTLGFLRSGAALLAPGAGQWSTALTVDFSLTFDFLTVYAPGTYFQ
jgi:hypothetical protein